MQQRKTKIDIKPNETIASVKLFDKKIFYFPFFSHPDPSVKRKSGFLTPVYGSSSEIGSWVNIPYFKVINEEKDLTFNPRIYADDKFIFQSQSIYIVYFLTVSLKSNIETAML